MARADRPRELNDAEQRALMERVVTIRAQSINTVEAMLETISRAPGATPLLRFKALTETMAETVSENYDDPRERHGVMCSVCAAAVMMIEELRKKNDKA